MQTEPIRAWRLAAEFLYTRIHALPAHGDTLAAHILIALDNDDTAVVFRRDGEIHTVRDTEINRLACQPACLYGKSVRELGYLV